MAWNATLAIDYGTRGKHTRIAGLRHEGPLVVQKSFYPDASGIVHNYVLHPPGGLVGGDRLQIDLHLATNAAAFLTTPAAGKIYRTPEQPSHFTLRGELQAGAELFWLPQENILFEGAHHRSRTEWIVDPAACLTAWDIQCLGRPGSGEGYGHGSLRSDLTLRTSAGILYIERNRWEGGRPLLDQAWGLAGRVAQGSMILHWPACEAKEWGSDLSQDGVEVGLTRRAGCLLMRGRASCPLRLKERFLQVLDALYQEHFGRSFARPRIWAY